MLCFSHREVVFVPDYAKMYRLMVTAASEALDALPDTGETKTGRDILQTALYKAEEMYIAAAETEPEH